MVESAFRLFKDHYDARFPGDRVRVKRTKKEFGVISNRWRTENHPRIYRHAQRTSDVIVLIHGLTDSPFFVSAIANEFYKLKNQAGERYVSVVMPLLPAHGLNENPGQAFRDLSFRHWRETVDNAVDVAAELGDRISIGGLSTGGSLSVDKVMRDQAKRKRQIKGGLFLFSAALQIAKYETLLNTYLGRGIARISDEKKLFWNPRTGIGRNPYRYSYVFQQGADELNKLNGEIIGDRKSAPERFAKVRRPLFVVHSKDDKAASIRRVRQFYNSHSGPKAAKWLDDVPHASVVLKNNIPKSVSDRLALEVKNPDFDEMMSECCQFFESKVAKGV